MNNYTKYFASEDTIRVHLDEVHWVDIKSEMPMGDFEKYESSMVQSEITPQATNRQSRRMNKQKKNTEPTKLKFSTGDIKLLEINIVAWSFENVPVDVSSINKLKESWCRKILEAIGEANPENPLEA